MTGNDLRLAVRSHDVKAAHHNFARHVSKPGRRAELGVLHQVIEEARVARHRGIQQHRHVELQFVHLREALQQMAEEGVVQLFSPEDGSQAIVGVVGALQLDVLKERLMGEYGLPVSFEMSRFSVCRWISSDQPAEMDKFLNVKRGDIARDLDGDPVFLAQDAFSLRYESERFPAIKMVAIKEYHVAKAA